MKLDVLHRRKAPASGTGVWLRTAWKPVLVFALFALLLSTRSVSRPQALPRIEGRNAAATSIPCVPLPAGVTTWDASMGSIILPTNDTAIDPHACVGGIVVPSGATLVIDGSKGPVLISSHGAGISVQGGELETTNTDATNTVTFDAQPEVASWDGISITADSNRKGDASLSYVSIARALTAVSINSGATSSPDDPHYGLTVRNSGIVVSYFDGIDAVNTPISVTGLGDGRFGTLNNIGSFGIKVTFDNSAQAVPDKALDVKQMTFGSSVPFGEKVCLPFEACSLGGIGNDAIKTIFLQTARKSVSITDSKFFKAGSYGLELENTTDPVVTGNHFNQNGVAVTQPPGTCPANAANKFPPIYLNNAVADLQSHVTGNFGQDDGLEAIVFNGTVSSPSFTWRTATTDPLQQLGFLLNGDLNMVGGSFTVLDGGVIKAKQGTLNLDGVTLNANNPGGETFTSLRDSTVGIDAICSVFVQSAPPTTLPAGEWGGINLINGSTGNIANAVIRYATTGVHIANGNSLAISGSVIGPTFADGVLDEGTPMVVRSTTFDCSVGVCLEPSSGNHGILADFHGASTLGAGLRVGGPNPADKNFFMGSVNEAIRGIGLTGQTVDIENNDIRNAGATGSAGSAGIYLEGSNKLTLKDNSVTGSGTGNVHYPAIWLNAVSNADFNGPISGNIGSGNALNAIAFHGDTKALTWQTVHSTGLLGYIVDGNLLVAGNLKLVSGNDYAPVQAGTITVQNGQLTSTGAVLTSLNEQTASVASCGSVFVPKVSGACAPPSAGDWGGLVLNPNPDPVTGTANTLTDSEVRYATTGISLRAPTGSLTTQNLTMSNSNVRFTSADGVSTLSPLLITGGAFTNNGGRAINIDLSAFAPGVLDTKITGGTTVAGSGQEGILAVGLAGQKMTIDRASIDHARAFGINLVDAGKTAGAVAGHLTLTNNTVTNTAASFPAIYLNGFTGPFLAQVHDNQGASNGLDAIAFHGTVTDDLTWQTARQTTDPTKPLGYLLDNTLTMQTGHTLTVKAGDIVKVGKGGLLDLQGVTLQADNTGTSIQKVFTSLSDNSTGVVACPSALLPGCTGASAGDWGGISLTGSQANGTVVNAAIRYAATGILITSGTPPTHIPSAYRLAVSRSTIGPSTGDGINAVKTAISVTDSTVSGGAHGITVDLTGATAATALRLSGDRFMSTSAEAILGQALAGQPVWITDNHVQGAGTFGIRLLSADQLVLRNNNISGSGGGPGANAGRYPAIYLNGVNANVAGDVRGNVGSANGLDAIVLHGTVTGSMSWITPSNQSATHRLGYLLDGALTVNGGDLTVNAGDVVKALGGPITINGGTLIADDDSSSATKIFTSLRDNGSPAALAAVSCPSVFAPADPCSPAAGDWGGLVITAGAKGNAAIEHGLIDYAATGIAIDSGPLKTGELDHFGDPLDFRLKLANGTQILNTTKDGINASDTPISLSDSIIGDPAAASPTIGAHGIIASFFSPPNCPAPTQPDCSLSITDHSQVAWTAKDGIVANGLNGHPVTITDTEVTHAGTYGIRLVGADQLTLSDNTVNASGLGNPAYPAIHLSHVIGDFNTEITNNQGTGNGLDALVFNGTSDEGLDWITPGAEAPILGYMLDDALTVDGNLTTTGVVKVLKGGIKVNGALNSIGAVFTSMKDGIAPAACQTVFVPSGCPSPITPADYWDGIEVDATPSNVTGGAIRYAQNGLLVSGASLKVTGHLHVSHISGDAITVKNAPDTSIFEDLTVDNVDGNGVTLVNTDADFSRDVFTSVGATALNSTGGTVDIDCSSFHNNNNGVSFDSASSIDESDVYNNSGSYDVRGTGGSQTARAIWFGQPNTSGKVSGDVSVRELLSSQAPVLTDPPHPGGKIEITGTHPTAIDTPGSPALGIGSMTATLTFSRRMDSTIDPAVTFKTSQLGDVTRDVTGSVGGTWNDRVWTSNPYPLDTSNATPGLNHLSVAGARGCVPDVTTNAMVVPPTKDFSAAVLPTTVAVHSGLTATYGGTATLKADLLTNGLPVNDGTGPVQFTILDAASHPFASASTGTTGGLATTDPVSIAGLDASLTPYGITAVFPGDGRYSASLPDATQTLLISKVATVTTTSASATAVATGTNITDQAVITGAASTAGGSITYKVFSSVNCSGAPVFMSSALAFAGGDVPDSGTWNATPAGSYQWQAVYSGDANHLGSTSACGNDPVVVAALTPTLATVASAGGTVGGTISDTANITGGSSPGGTVDFALYGPGDPTCLTDLAGSSFKGILLSGGSASTPNYTTTQAGTYHWVAAYSGDLNNVPVTTGCRAEPVVMTNATPTLSTVPSVGGTVGGTITDTATISGGYSPTGSVRFQLFAPGDTSCATDLLAGNAGFQAVALNAGAATSPAYTSTSVGTYYWVAIYSGDGNNDAVPGSCSSETVSVAKASPTVASASSAGGTVGDIITDDATVSGGFNPSGTVTFQLYAPGDTTCTTDLLASDPTFHGIALSAGAASSPDFSTDEAGTYHWVVTYNGDSNNAQVATHCLDDPVTLQKATPTIATVSSAGGTVPDPISDTAIVSDGFGPSGTVTFALYGPGDTSCSTDLLAADLSFHDVPLENGAATTPNYITSNGGTYRWIATYNGDDQNASVSTECGDEQVSMVPAAPSPTVGSVTPNSGPVAGNTSVTIIGTHFAGATAVKFGTASATISTVTDTQITVESPVGPAPGAVDVTVTTPSGTSAVNAPADQYTFVSYQATVLGDTPSLYWRLGEASGTTAGDASGHGHDGTYSATGVSLGTAGALLGDGDTGLTLNGTNGAIQETSGAGAPVGNNARSFELWLKTTTTSAQPLLTYGTGSLSAFSFSMASKDVVINDGTETLTFTAASTLADGSWHHLVVTYDGTSARVYVDGSAVGGSQSPSGALATALDANGIEIGRDNASGFFTGSLDEAAIYGSALSSAAIANHYHAGHGN